MEIESLINAAQRSLSEVSASLSARDFDIAEVYESLTQSMEVQKRLSNALLELLLETSKVDETMFIDWILTSDSDFATRERSWLSKDYKLESLEDLRSYMEENIAKFAGSQAFVEKLHSYIVHLVKVLKEGSEASAMLGLLEFAVGQVIVNEGGKRQLGFVYPEVGSYFNRSSMQRTVDGLGGKVVSVAVPAIYSSLPGSPTIGSALVRKSLVEAQ